jgi:hypothetical protein
MVGTFSVTTNNDYSNQTKQKAKTKTVDKKRVYDKFVASGSLTG